MKHVSLLVGLMLMVSGAHAATQYRDFTSADGKTIRGAIKAYDAKSQKVTIERDNKRTSSVPITIFSQADQDYILKWQKQKGVRSTSKFKISCDRRVVKNWTEEKIGTINYSDGSSVENQVTGKMSYKETAYDIELANRNNYALADLLLEYCIFYEQEMNRGQAAQQGVLFGTLPLDSLAPGERKKIQTGSVVTHKDESNASFTNARVYKGEVFGISLRLYLVEGEEKTLVRELTLPDSLLKRYEWTPETKAVGSNK